MCTGTDFEKVFTSNTIQQLITWIQEAGEIALRHFENSSFAYKADDSFVTQADLEIEHFLTQKIKTAFPSHLLIGEETDIDISSKKLEPYVWTIDPIDGTTAFMQGLPGWGIAIGMLYRGQPRLGFYYMPLLKDLTYVDEVGRVFCKGRQLSIDSLRPNWKHKGFLALNTAAYANFHIDVKHSRALGSHTTNLVYTARGTAVASLIPKAYLWDLATGAAIVSGIGGEFRYLDGTAVNFISLLNRQLIPQPIIAGHPNVLGKLTKAISLKHSA